MSYNQFIHALKDLVDDWNKNEYPEDDGIGYMDQVAALVKRYLEDPHDEPATVRS